MFLYGFDDKDVTKGDVIAQQNNEKYVVGEWERLKKGYELRSAASLFRCENDIQVTIAAKKLAEQFFMKHKIHAFVDVVLSPEKRIELGVNAILEIKNQSTYWFHHGKEIVINSILDCLETSSDRVAIYLRQVGGGSRYCTFECPICCKNSGSFKMSSNTGWCDSCNTQFQNLDTVCKLSNDKEYPDEIGTVEFYHCNKI